ncbi:MAG TPA: hypothetical protein DCE23_06940 [Firmicutes bacterium]|nr:hypothetical protein [Bacillota bacterium]
MVVLRLGKINNEERKFIPTKKEYLDRYLNSMKKIEEYELTQTYKDGYKYRRYNDNGDCKYTVNNKMSKITDVRESNEEEFLEVMKENGRCVRKIRKYYNDGPYEIDVDCFIEPVEMVMIEVSTDKAPLDEYVPPKGFVEVSNTKVYENYGIYNGSIKSVGTIIEGTDGVGKSVTIEELIKKGIICQDRCMDVISRNMLFDISMEDRTKKYQEYLKKIDNKIIFLVNNDKKELESRINKREVLSQYDEEAYRYNQLYLDTYNYMKDRNMTEDKLYLVDCTNLTLEEQVEKIERIINA